MRYKGLTNCEAVLWIKKDGIESGVWETDFFICRIAFNISCLDMGFSSCGVMWEFVLSDGTNVAVDVSSFRKTLANVLLSKFALPMGSRQIF